MLVLDVGRVSGGGANARDGEWPARTDAAGGVGVGPATTGDSLMNGGR